MDNSPDDQRFPKEESLNIIQRIIIDMKLKYKRILGAICLILGIFYLLGGLGIFNIKLNVDPGYAKEFTLVAGISGIIIGLALNDNIRKWLKGVFKEIPDYRY